MINRKENESRLAYLLRVAIRHITDHASDCTTDYDGTDCDGSCLAGELQNELDDLIEREERQDRLAEALGYSKPCTKEEHAKPLKQPEVVPLGLCPQCRRHLDSEPDHAARGERVTCRVCNIHATGDNFKEACTRLRAAFGPKPVRLNYATPCPRCTYPLTEKPLALDDAPNVTVEITCRYCNLQSVGETREEALGFMRTNAKLAPNGYDKKPAPLPCLCESGFTPECPVHSVSIHTAADAPLSCGPNCKHTPEEHQAFDIGVDMGERSPEAENPCRKFTNPREDVIEAWEAGASVGRKNRENVEGGPAYS